jgi:hypothetical protein
MNPFEAVRLDMGLANNATGPAGTLHLLCTFGRDNYAGTTSGNPYTEVKRLLVASAGRSNGYREIEALLTSGEMRWNQR